MRRRRSVETDLEIMWTGLEEANAKPEALVGSLLGSARHSTLREVPHTWLRG